MGTIIVLGFFSLLVILSLLQKKPPEDVLEIISTSKESPVQGEVAEEEVPSDASLESDEKAPLRTEKARRTPRTKGQQLVVSHEILSLPIALRGPRV